MNSHEQINQLIQIVTEIAQTEITPRFLNADSKIKADGSLLSDADLATQAALVRKLPEIIAAPVLGEEMSHKQQRYLWDNSQHGLWVVDPIDGTSNFVNGLPHFAVSVAFVQSGVPQLGVIHNPISQETFYAVKGQGAFLNGNALPLRQSSPRLYDAIAGVEIKRLRSGKLSNSISNLSPIRSIRSMGSSTLDWCYLAAGRYDVYLHGGQNLWDYSAGALIFEEAGGKLATLEGDDFWSGEHVFQRSVIAAIEPELFEKWLKWIRTNQ